MVIFNPSKGFVPESNSPVVSDKSGEIAEIKPADKNKIKTPREPEENIHSDASLGKIESMKIAGSLVNKALDAVGESISIETTFDDLDRLCEETIRRGGGVPGLVGFNGYRHSSFVTLNSEIANIMPANYLLQDGDILNFGTLLVTL